VLRFWNNDVLSNIEGVLAQIEHAVVQVTPTPDPSPQGGGE
jgi:very-short-patch-repair endonuclease